MTKILQGCSSVNLILTALVPQLFFLWCQAVSAPKITSVLKITLSSGYKVREVFEVRTSTNNSPVCLLCIIQDHWSILLKYFPAQWDVCIVLCFFENPNGPPTYFDETHFADKQGDKKGFLQNDHFLEPNSSFHREAPIFYHAWE